MELYELLPSIIREKDRLGSGVAATEETVLQKIFYALEQDSDVTANFIEGLRSLLNPESCPVEYLPLLEYFLGSSWPATWSEGTRRLVIESLVQLYHNSGQRLSWRAILNTLGYAGFFPWELWKFEVYEDFDYTKYGPDDGEYYGLYHAARVDISNEDGVDINVTAQEKGLIENFRPIHVLIRVPANEVTIPPATAKEMDPDSTAYELTYILDDPIEEADDLFSMTITCIATCESICETSCEFTCETVAVEPGFNGQISVVDPATYGPVVLTIVNGEVQTYAGTVLVIDPSTGLPGIPLIIVSGVITNYTGTIIVTDPSTGDNFTLQVVADGRIFQ